MQVQITVGEQSITHEVDQDMWEHMGNIEKRLLINTLWTKLNPYKDRVPVSPTVTKKELMNYEDQSHI